jgi:hypothetical protein
MFFNLNIDSKTQNLIPYEVISKIINSNTIIKYLEIEHLNKFGVKSYSFFLKNFRFIKMINLLDFDFRYNNEIKDLKVTFEYDKEILITKRRIFKIY